MQAQPSPRRPPVPASHAASGGGASPHVHALEQQLDIAVRQVEHTKRLYQRLHEHNDDMEGEFLRLRGILEGFRNRLQFTVRQDVRRLRGDLDSIRDTVVFHTGSFQRELHALERVLSSAIGHGSVLTCDHEILYSGSGRVTLPLSRDRHAASGEDTAVVAPRPVATLNSPPQRAGADPKQRAAQLREAAGILRDGPPAHTTAGPRKNPLDASPLRAVAKGARKKKTAQHANQAATGRAVAADVSSAHDESSIEFFSDAEGAATDTSPRTYQRGGRSRTSIDSEKHNAPLSNDTHRTPSHLVLQAVEVAQQRAIAERQGKQIGELNDALQRMHLDKLQLQDQLKHQNEQFQAYLHQMKAVHREESVTLRGQIDLLSRTVASREGSLRPPQAADGQIHSSRRAPSAGAKQHETDDASSPGSASIPLESHVASSSYGGLVHSGNLFDTDEGTSRKTRKPRKGSQTAERQRAEAHAKQLLEERHRQHGGFVPRENKASDVIRDGLWAQRVLEQRSANTIRPLFPKVSAKPSSASRSSSVSSANTKGYAQRQR